MEPPIEENITREPRLVKEDLKDKLNGFIQEVSSIKENIGMVQESQGRKPGEGINWLELDLKKKEELKEVQEHFKEITTNFFNEWQLVFSEFLPEKESDISRYCHDVNTIMVSFTFLELLEGLDDGDLKEKFLVKKEKTGEREKDVLLVPGFDVSYYQHTIRVTENLRDEIFEQERKEEVKISELLTEVLAYIKASCVEEKILSYFKELRVDLHSDEESQLIGSRSGLYRAFYNILRNSQKYAQDKVCAKGEDGEISVKISKKDNETMVEIQDNALGIDTEEVIKSALKNKIISVKQLSLLDEEERDKMALGLIFQEGISGRGSTGKGLAISENIIKKSGGKIEVENHPGEGVKFIITLPRSQ